MIARIALGLYWLALAAATHYPRVRLPDEVPHGDKLLHFAAFGTLALLFWLATRRVLLAAAVLVPYALVDEFTQQYVGRYTDVADAIANVAGIAVVLAAIAAVTAARRRSTAPSDARSTGPTPTPSDASRTTPSG